MIRNNVRFAFTGLVALAAGCGKSDKAAPSGATTGSAVVAAAEPTPPPTAPARPPPPAVKACSLITATEVGAIVGKTVVMDDKDGSSCTFGLDPAEKEKAMAALQKDPMKAAQAMAGGGKGGIKVPDAISNQLVIDLSIDHDTQTEDQIKAMYVGIGSAVNGAKPTEHGLNETVTAAKDLPGIGDWAFVTNIASVNMGFGASVRGRLLDAHKGTWHMTVSVTIAPDPGASKLDDEISQIAKTAIAKLP